jgi:hypothetical protein
LSEIRVGLCLPDAADARPLFTIYYLPFTIHP